MPFAVNTRAATRATTLATLLVLMAAVGVAGQAQKPSNFVAVTLVVDGKTVPCDRLIVRLQLDRRPVAARVRVGGFFVPAAFKKKGAEWGPDEKVDVRVTCGEYRLSFPQLHPSWVSAGLWELVVVHPPFWFEKFSRDQILEHGEWLSYLDSECNGCDPGVIVATSHPDPPISFRERLRHEQPDASGESARDIAYALAVFDTEYQRNRNYLVGLLNACLSRAKDSPEDDVCDGKLFDYLTNLYWRGDDELLDLFLQSADSRRDVIHEIGSLYADLLDRRTEAVIRGMQTLPIDKQRIICSLAGEDDYSIDAPKTERMVQQLHAIGGEVADRCLQEAEKAAGHVFGGI